MEIFAHRGFYGCTDIGQDYLLEDDVKGELLKTYAPENSEESVKKAFDNNFNVEIDVVMTKDRELIVTHTNELKMHSFDAKEADFASQKNLPEILKMKTGLGGRTSEYLTYKRFLELLSAHKNLTANVEIKGNIHPLLTMDELDNPNIVERIFEETSKALLNQIIWSSFSLSNLKEAKRLSPSCRVAQLFYPQGIEETNIYKNKDDVFMQFNLKNLKYILEQMPGLNAVHPCIDSLNDIELIEFCFQQKLKFRPWVLFERNPLKNDEAKKKILFVKKLNENYPIFDVITDFPEEVKSLNESV